jgi:hypothetical protein
MQEPRIPSEPVGDQIDVLGIQGKKLPSLLEALRACRTDSSGFLVAS